MKKHPPRYISVEKSPGTNRVNIQTEVLELSNKAIYEVLAQVASEVPEVKLNRFILELLTSGHSDTPCSKTSYSTIFDSSQWWSKHI